MHSLAVSNGCAAISIANAACSALCPPDGAATRPRLIGVFKCRPRDGGAGAFCQRREVLFASSWTFTCSRRALAEPLPRLFALWTETPRSARTSANGRVRNADTAYLSAIVEIATMSVVGSSTRV
jgi:hypothetical protein